MNAFNVRILKAYANELSMRMSVMEEDEVAMQNQKILCLLVQCLDLLDEADAMDLRIECTDGDGYETTNDSTDGAEWLVSIGYARLVSPSKRKHLRERLEHMTSFFQGEQKGDARPNWTALGPLLGLDVEVFKVGFLLGWRVVD